jgi:ABC-2 type transport system permease protein
VNVVALREASPERPGRESRAVSVWRAEILKLRAQLPLRVLVLVCLLGPFAFGLVLSEQAAVPADTLLGVWVHESGYAVSLVVLGFAGYLGFPVIAGVLAGDLFSSEDRYGTWKTVLTRSRTAEELFAGKVLAALTAAVALTAIVALSSLAAGLAFTGNEPLVGLSGVVIPSGEALGLVLVSWLLSIPPMLGFTCLAMLFSVASRNGIVGVLGPLLVALVMQLLSLIGSGTVAHMLLLTTAFTDWHGLLSSPKFYGPMVIGVLVGLLWAAACLAVSWRILRSRDFGGAPVARRSGWVQPLRAVVAGAGLILLLAVAGGWGPSAVTSQRLEASIAPAFDALAVHQQRELGRTVPAGTALKLHTRCSRRSGAGQGPGDDWSCALITVAPQSGAEPLSLTPIVYDVSVKSEGCYKAQSPPSLVGTQMMSDVHGHSVVNPLFTIYGCFDVTSAAPCPEGTACAERKAGADTHGNGGGSRQTPAGRGVPDARPSGKQRQRELQQLRQAERIAGPRVMREVEEAERKAR